MQPYTFNFPIWVEFGTNTVEQIGEIAEAKAWEKPLVVTDQGILEAGIADEVLEPLESAAIEYSLYDGVEPNPTVSMVDEATRALSENGCDFVIGVGGGSSMDVAKTAAMMATNSGVVQDYEVSSVDDVMAGPIENHPKPLVTVPTTAGTGSEVDFWSVITDTDRGFKMALGQSPLYPGGPYLGASVSLVDPGLTTSLPPRQTAATGFDAFSHALENFVSAACPRIVKPLAREVMGLIPEYLPRAYADGNDLDAREHMMYAANIAGIGENFAGFGAIHSLAEVTGGMYPDIPHGEAIAIYTPPVMRYNLQTVPHRYGEVASAMGVDVTGLSAEAAAKRAVQEVEALIDSVDLPTRLSEVGVAEADLSTIAEKSLDTIEIHDNPRSASVDNLLAIAESCF